MTFKNKNRQNMGHGQGLVSKILVMQAEGLVFVPNTHIKSQSCVGLGWGTQSVMPAIGVETLRSLEPLGQAN